MLSLELEKKTATLEGVKVRKESVGTERFLAADVWVSCTCDADILAYFSPRLKEMIFEERQAGSGGDLATTLALRDTYMAFPLGREEEMVGVAVQLHYGVGPAMRFDDARVNKVTLWPKEEGVVVVNFRVQVRVSDVQLGRLGHMLAEDFVITVEPSSEPPPPIA
jgi:hypothetical protein